MENHKRPSLRRRRLWFWGVRLWFSRGYRFGLFEGGWFCPLSLAVWWWLGCGWVEGGVGVGAASLSGGVLGGFPSEGSRMGFLCLLKGGYGG